MALKFHAMFSAVETCGRRDWPRELLAPAEVTIRYFDGIGSRSSGSGSSTAETAKGHASMATGTVKWFNGQKGYGFIQPDEGGADVFVHISAVERSGLTGLRDDQKVTFDIESGRDGRESAINLQLAEVGFRGAAIPSCAPFL